VSGLARTVRGPSMSAAPGKIAVSGVAHINGKKVIVLNMLQAKNPELVFQAKIGILTASLLAGALGFIWLRFIAKPANA